MCHTHILDDRRAACPHGETGVREGVVMLRRSVPWLTSPLPWLGQASSSAGQRPLEIDCSRATVCFILSTTYRYGGVTPSQDVVPHPTQPSHRTPQEGAKHDGGNRRSRSTKLRTRPSNGTSHGQAEVCVDTHPRAQSLAHPWLLTRGRGHQLGGGVYCRRQSYDSPAGGARSTTNNQQHIIRSQG